MYQLREGAYPFALGVPERAAGQPSCLWVL